LTDLLRDMQDILDRKSPVITSPVEDSSECEDSEEEDNFVFADNMNYNKAVAEFELFENYKQKKHRPNFRSFQVKHPLRRG
jgi:hypothetical protein